MKFYYPTDKDGNPIGFKTPESQVYDKSGNSLTSKLSSINENINNLNKDMTAATSDTNGKSGLVPAPSAGSSSRYLRSDGTWSTPSDDTKLPLAGGQMTGSLSFANNTMNAMGDDVAIGDHNVNGSLGVKGLNSTPKVSFIDSNNTVYTNIGAEVANEAYSGHNFNIKGSTLKINNGSVSVVYNSSTESIDFKFA